MKGTEKMNNIYIKLLTAFGDSKIAAGTKALINDVSAWLLAMVPIVGAVFIIYFAIRRGNADEQDKRQWDGRIKTAIISIILGVTASVIVGMISKYYG